MCQGLVLLFCLFVCLFMVVVVVLFCFVWCCSFSVLLLFCCCCFIIVVVVVWGCQAHFCEAFIQKHASVHYNISFRSLSCSSTSLQFYRVFLQKGLVSESSASTRVQQTGYQLQRPTAPPCACFAGSAKHNTGPELLCRK